MALNMKEFKILLTIDTSTGAVTRTWTQPTLGTSDDANIAIGKEGVMVSLTGPQQTALNAFGTAVLAAEKTRLGI